MRLAAPVAAATLILAAGLLTSSASATTHTTPLATRTHHAVVRPVDDGGNPQRGWTVKRERGYSVDCYGSSVSAVDDDIWSCGPSAVYLPSCWKSSHHTMLCLRDARRHQLVRVRLAATHGLATAPPTPTPQDFNLANGQRCSIRVGGAWGTLPSHPQWVGFFSCTHGSVYGPPSGDGINRASARWTVHLWKSGTADTVVRRAVAKVFYVGTAYR